MTTGQKIKRSAYQWQKNLLLGVWEDEVSRQKGASSRRVSGVRLRP